MLFNKKLVTKYNKVMFAIKHFNFRYSVIIDFNSGLVLYQLYVFANILAINIYSQLSLTFSYNELAYIKTSLLLTQI